MGSEMFARILSIREDFHEFILSKKHLGPSSFFRGAFNDLQLNYWFVLFFKAIKEKNLLRQLIPPETKAASLILFALKLFFGLDDRREYKMEVKNSLKKFKINFSLLF